MTKYTKGPWYVDERSDWSIEVRSKPEGYVVASVCDDISELEHEAMPNAKLIAAAPDLLEACQLAKKYLEPDLVEPGRTVFWKLVSAIKKAAE